jgi:diguanylate cyclase (GGDEF)-like protein
MDRISCGTQIRSGHARGFPCRLLETTLCGETLTFDWSKVPDLAAIGALACAFGSVARRCRSSVSGLWLTGWGMIALHFAAFTLVPASEWATDVVQIVGLGSLTWAGILFMWASVPYRRKHSSPRMLAALLAANTLYIALMVIGRGGRWTLNLAALLLGVLPLAVAVSALPRFGHRLRWVTVFLYVDLSIFLLAMQYRGTMGQELALNAVLFTVYLGCGIHFWYAYRRATAGAFITIGGFFFWAAVFVVAPILSIWFPHVQVDNEVWNLPKYVTAVGMILLLLEDQIDFAKYLALHDELTGLPNRRLFQDRLAGALERCRRNGTRAALLLIDLNDFKQVNDTVGHHAGDQLLRHVGKAFLGRVRRSDTVARTGGDEFAVILEHPINREDALRIAAELMHSLGEPLRIGGHELRIGASVGAAIFPEDAEDSEAMFVAADCDMYAHKRDSHRKQPSYARQSVGDADSEARTDSSLCTRA